MTTTSPAPPRGTVPLRSARRLNRLLVAAVLVSTVVGAWLAVRARQAGGLLIGDAAAGVPVAAIAAISVWLVVTAATAMAWMRWMTGVQALLEELDDSALRPRWGASTWVAPPWALYAPAVAVAWLWRRSSPTGKRRSPRLVVVWWLLYLAGNPLLVGVAAFLGAWRMALYGSVAWIAAGLVALRLVDRITSKALMAYEIDRRVETGWRKVTTSERTIPALAGVLAVVGFVAYQGFAISESLVGALNGWQVEDAVPGLCFGGVTGDRISAFVDVPCDDPHRGEVVGSHLVQGGPEAEWDEGLLQVFAVGLCRSTAEAYTGVPAGDLDDSLVVTWPTRTDWKVNGERDVACLVLVDEGTTGSLADPRSERVPHPSLEPGDCFLDEPGWVTARLVECSPPAMQVTATAIVDRTLTSPHPSAADLERVAERTCREGATFDAPTVAEWQQGRRSVLCLEPA